MKRFLLLRCTRVHFLFIAFVGIIISTGSVTFGQQLSLYTPYTHIKVPPGESIKYDFQLINNGASQGSCPIKISGLPEGWDYTLSAGGWAVEELSVLPKEKEKFTLNLQVPLEIKKGKYRFNVQAAGYHSLPLTVAVDEEGTFKTEFTTKQANLEGHTDTDFTFTTQLKNLTAEAQSYSLRNKAPRGWSVIFKANYKQVSAVSIEPNSTTDISVTVKPPSDIAAGTYTIPVSVGNAQMNEDLDLEVAISGSYGMELSTPSGILNTRITAGGDQEMELLLKNTGTANLENIKLNAQTPLDWKVDFAEEEILQLPPGESKKVKAIIKASSKSIPGDYIVNINAKTPEADSKVSLRTQVKTPLLSGWLGMGLIISILTGMGYLFKKYGRR